MAAHHHLRARHRHRPGAGAGPGTASRRQSRDLPEEVRRQGVTTSKSSPDLMMVVHMLSPDDTYDQLYVSNYARSRVRDVLLRARRRGQPHHLRRARIFAAHLARPGKALGARHDVGRHRSGATRAERAGVRRLDRRAAQRHAEPHSSTRSPRKAASTMRATSAMSIVKSTEDGRLITLQDVARIELGAKDYITNSYLNGKQAVALGIFQRPGTNALAAADEIKRTIADLAKDFPAGAELRHRLQPDRVHRRNRSTRSTRRSSRPSLLVVIVIIVFLQSLAHGDRAHRGDPGLADRHAGGAARARLLAQHAHPVRPGAGDRHRGRRCHRRCRECRAQHPPRLQSARRPRIERWTRSARRSWRSRWC